MILLSDSDVRSVLNAAARTDEVRSQRGAVEELLRATASLVRCDRIFWTRLDATGPVRKLAEIGLPQEPWPAPWDDWLAHLGEHPIMSQRHGAVTSVSDVFTRREFRETWLYHEAFRPAGIAHEIGVQLSHPVSEIHTIVISRSRGSDFTDRDHLVLKLLRPHLDAAIHRLITPAPELTPRETAVMELVRDGCSNRQIGHRLGISEATVGKHLEHIYQRTGAQSRLQALDRCGQSLS